jgi:hypothetical protein
MKRLVFFTLLLLSRGAFATPSVFSISGNTTANLSTVTVTGVSFGTKSPATPLAWADFETNVNPNSLGQHLTWDENQSFAWSATAGYNGTGGAVGSGDTVSPVAYTLRINDTTSDGATHYIFRRTKLNFALGKPVDNGQNTKIFRVFEGTGGAGTYPNLYAAINNGRIFVEDQTSPDTGFFTGDINRFQTANVWNTEEFLLKQSSNINLKDGEFTYKVNGAQQCSGNVITRYTTHSGFFGSWYIQHWVFSNIGIWTGGWNNSNTVTSDDVYFDKTYCRVMISNNATLASATKVSIAVPSAWSDNSVTCKLIMPTIDFPASSTAYLHVCDSSNNCSPGKSFTVGASGASNPAPTITSVTPVTVSTSAGTSVVATCTGLSATLNGATLGGTACTGVTRNSATQFTATLPAKTSGSYDLVVINSDALTGTLSSAITTRNAPFVISIFPNSIYTSGGNTIQFVATDLVTGFSIKVGTQAATSPTFISSTAGSFVAPGMSAGAYDITITGPAPDSQVRTTTGLLTYSDPPAETTKVFPWLKQ